MERLLIIYSDISPILQWAKSHDLILKITEHPDIHQPDYKLFDIEFVTPEDEIRYRDDLITYLGQVLLGATGLERELFGEP